MAAFLSSTRLAVANKMTVRLAVLAFFDFAGAPRYYWLGAGNLRTADSQIWEGTAGVGDISALASPIGTIATNVTFSLSGVDARVATLARQQSTSVKGRDVRVYVQFFTGDLDLLDVPVQVWSGVLDLMTYKLDDSGKYTVSVTAEDPLGAARSKAPYGFLDDTDQQARFSGDRGLELVGSLPGKTINWPS